MQTLGSRRRVIRLLLLLLDGDGFTLAELSARLDVKERALRYDIEALEAEGLALERIQASGGDRPGRQPTRIRLSAGARQRLAHR